MVGMECLIYLVSVGERMVHPVPSCSWYTPSRQPSPTPIYSILTHRVQTHTYSSRFARRTTTNMDRVIDLRALRGKTKPCSFCPVHTNEYRNRTFLLTILGCAAAAAESAAASEHVSAAVFQPPWGLQKSELEDKQSPEEVFSRTHVCELVSSLSK